MRADMLKAAETFAAAIGADQAGPWLVRSDLGDTICGSLEHAVDRAGYDFIATGQHPVSIAPAPR